MSIQKNEYQPHNDLYDTNRERDWGRLLYRTRWYFKLHWCIIIASVIAMAVFILLMLKTDEFYLFTGIVFSGIAFLGSCAALPIAKAIDIYEKGVVYRTMISYQAAAFDDVEQYALESGVFRKAGLQMGGTFILTLIIKDSSKRICLMLSSDKNELPEPLKIIRKRVHEICVARMLKQIEEKDATQWTNEIALRKEEIVISTSKKTHRLPYHELVLSWENNEEPHFLYDDTAPEPLFQLLPKGEYRLHFFIKGDTSLKPIFKLSSRADGFFTGYDCLKSYCHFDEPDED